ncbi:hypothetical protein U6G28_01960 [Actinomycetaceae bacterium MB13-C1-2]|nr:hypothetical protein U6G28_01960 [Actinomycetaceae bacterium MB13-C1-2]
MVPTSLLAILLVSGCSPVGGGEAEKPPEFEWNSTTYDMPLEQLFPGISLGAGLGVPEESTVKAEEDIATCMKEQGFEYVPNLSSKQNQEDASTADFQDDPDTYGIVESAQLSDKPPEDPNQEYVQSLPTVSQVEYQIAMYGNYTEDGGPGPSSSGCHGQAYEEIAKGMTTLEKISNSPEFEDAREVFESVASQIQSPDGSALDPFLAKLEGSWSECMEQKGFSGLKNILGSFQYVEQRVAEKLDMNGNLSSADRSDLLRVEQDIYAADMACQKQVNWHESRSNRIIELQLEAINSRYEEVMRLSDAYKLAVGQDG